MIAADNFESLANAILAAGGGADPSELHGFVCGLLAAGAQPDRARWQEELARLLELDAVPADLNGQFVELAQESRKQLDDDHFDFQLLLSDDEDIGPRTQNLGHWCQGFLHGFGVGAHKGKLQPTSEEALQDLGAIAQVDAEVDAESAEASEAAESQLLELQEHVRIAALNIYTEVCAAAKKSPSGPILH